MELPINLGKTNLSQLGYVYKDIEKQAKIMESMFGIQKFGFYTNEGKNYLYRGKPTKFKVKIGLSRIFNLQIELIELIEGDCIYKEAIETGNEGFHHYAILVDDLQPIKEIFLNQGFDIVHEGGTPLYKVIYFDTLNELGVYLEYQESKRKRRRINEENL